MAWLSRINITEDEYLHADQLNGLALDDRNWGGDVNGGGHKLSNVILEGSGSFEFTPSPLTITEGADGQSVSIYTEPGTTTPTPPRYRWTVGKDSIAETGANAGSNFAIKRYADDGTTVLGTPIAINRATGVITLGQQFWSGPVNGNGQTLSNVILTGYLADPTTAQGDLITRTTSAVTKLALGTNGQVLTVDTSTGTGLKWAAPVGAVSSVFTRTGAVTAQTGDYTVAQVTGAVADTRQILNGTGITGGGNLTADRTLSVVADTTVQRHRVSLAGSVIGTRQEINFVNGANITITAADDTPNNRVNVTVAATGSGHTIQDEGVTLTGRSKLNFVGAGVAATDDAANDATIVTVTGGGAGSQSPWLQNVDANTFKLFNATGIGIGVATAAGIPIGTAGAGTAFLSIKGPSAYGAVELATGGADADASSIGHIVFTDPLNNQTDKRMAFISGYRSGPTANNRGSFISFWLRPDNSTTTVERMRIDNAGNVGIGTATVLSPATAGRTYLSLKGSTDSGVLELGTGAADADASLVGHIIFSDPVNNQADKRLAAIAVVRSGTTANNRGGAMIINTRADGAGGSAERMRITSVGRVGIGTSAPNADLLQVGTGTPLAPGMVDIYATNYTVAVARANLNVLTTDATAVDKGGTLGLGGVGGGNPYAFAILAGRAEGASTYAGYFQICTLASGGSIAERMRITSAGNVGIGSTNPSDLLTISSSAGDTPFTIENTAASGKKWKLFSSGSGSGVPNVGGFTIWDGSSNAARLAISSGGNVGIGTAGPTATFMIYNPAVSSPPSLSASATGEVFLIHLPNPGGRFVIGEYSTSPWSIWMQSKDSGGGALPLAINPLGGMVGIGTTSPTAPLHLKNSTPMIALEDTASHTWNVYTGAGGGGSGKFSIFNAADRLVIDLSGNVGISNVSPGYKLDVSGDVNCTGAFRVNGTAIGGGVTTTANYNSSGRALGTIYQNTSGRPRCVFVGVSMWGGTLNTTTGGLTAYTGSGSPPTVVAGQFLTMSTSNSAGAIAGGVCFWVLPNHYYQVTTGYFNGSAPSFGINAWSEWD